MKLIKKFGGGLSAVFSLFLLNLAAFAEEEFVEAIEEEIVNFTEEDRLAFGIMPIWLFLLILAGVTALTIIVIIEIVKRKHK